MSQAGQKIGLKQYFDKTLLVVKFVCSGGGYFRLRSKVTGMMGNFESKVTSGVTGCVKLINIFTRKAWFNLHDRQY